MVKIAMAGELKLKDVKLTQLVRQVGEEAFNQKSLSVHVSVPSEPQLKVEITRGQRGGYGWTISFAGQDMEKVLATIKEVDAKLREEFLEE